MSEAFEVLLLKHGYRAHAIRSGKRIWRILRKGMIVADMERLVARTMKSWPMDVHKYISAVRLVIFKDAGV
jgi:hypothetical protein